MPDGRLRRGWIGVFVTTGTILATRVCMGEAIGPGERVQAAESPLDTAPAK